MPGLQILSRDSTITADEVAAFGMPTIGPVGRQGDEEEEQEEEEYDDDDCETRDVESWNRLPRVCMRRRMAKDDVCLLTNIRRLMMPSIESIASMQGLKAASALIEHE